MIRIFWMACMIGSLLSQSSQAAERISGESLVLSGEQPGSLMTAPIDPKSVVVRSTYLPGGKTYEADRDYRVDAQAGTIARLPGSRIPDFATNVLYGKKDFNHGQFPGFGNKEFFVYVDYEFAQPMKLAEERDVSATLSKTAAKLRAGKPIKIIAFGDSIAAGGEASSPELQFPALYAAHLQKLFPTAKVTLENGSTGGDTTAMGMPRLEEKVLSRSPDLVLVAFGMNDHNLPEGGGVAVEDFEKNLKQIVARIREKTGAEVILLSTFPPNPDWHFSTHQMWKYNKATRDAAEELNAAYADVFSVWKKVMKRKDPSSLLANNINHPTDFGHWLYFQALTALKF